MTAAALGLASQLGAQTYTYSRYAGLYSTAGVAVDASGTVFVTAFYSHTILRITSGGVPSIFAGTSGASGAADGRGAAARFSNPRALAVDAQGNVFVADTGNHAIRKITPAGEVTTYAGLAGARGWEDGDRLAARFDSPQGIAVDGAGNLFVADTGTRTIRRISAQGAVTTLAGLGYVSGFADGNGLEARFDTPQGVAIAPNGDLYVADTNNHAVRRITPTGATTTLAGSLTNRGFLDGIGSLARFDSPQALTIDATGNLFVADSGNNTIRKVTPAGLVTTIGGTFGFSSDTVGVGAAATFNQPRGIAVAATGELYIADAYSVRLGTPSSQLAITVQPQSQNVAAGSTARFHITATGASPITFQWQKDGAAILGATDNTLTVASVQPASGGAYSVVVSNPVTTLTSTSALLTVLTAVPNDNFASAQLLTGSTGQASGQNNGATGELTEPTHVNPFATGSSLWYRWTPAESGTAIFEFGANFPVLSAVYLGSNLGNLVRIAQGAGSRLTFSATAGTTYAIAVGSSSPSLRGNVTLTWRLILNDAFAQARELAGASGQIAGDNNGATGEPGEPNHFNASGRNTSIWYRWRPGQNAVAIIDTVGSSFDTVLAVYTGSAVGSLTRVAQDYNSAAPGNRSRVAFVTDANTTYSIAVGTFSYGGGPVILNWQLTSLPVLTFPIVPISQVLRAGETFTLTTTAVSSTPVTYQWLRDGTAIPGATTATYSFPVTAADDGRTFIGVVSNNTGTARTPPFSLNVLVPPANDNFAAAQSVGSLTGSVSGTNVNATGEPGEPPHWNAGGAASSVWYRWTPDTSGLAVLDTVGSTFDTVLAVYTGASLGSLTRVIQDDDRGGGRTSQVSFAATAATPYFIAIGSNNNGGRGSVRLNWQLSPALAIATPPASQTVAAGATVTFSVQATGSAVTYQWRRNGDVIPGATNATLTVANVQGGSDASYTVTVTNTSGSVTSAPATLAVATPALTSLAVRNSRVGGSLLWALAANGSTLVAVGNGGAIISSLDNGRTWTPRNSGTTAWLVGVTFGAGQFVAVGDGGIVLTSTDAVTWTQTASGNSQRLNNVIYADGKFVTVGEGGTILTSPDARVWTARSSGTARWLHGLAYNTRIGHFAASGQGGVFLYSSDGATWNELPIAGLSADLEATVAVDSYADFVAIGQDGVVAAVRQNQLVLKTGETLITWSAESSRTGTAVRLRGLVQGASALFATGEDGKVLTATDHRGPWYTLPSGTTGNLLAGLYHQDALFIVGENEIALQSEPLFSSRMINISTRGQVGTGSNLMISGFVITGQRPKTVLVRAAGPTLAASFGLAGTLNAPVLTLVDSQNRPVATNTGWSTSANAADLSVTAARVGAFPFAANSADSALLATLTPGAYTALISGSNNATGLSIVEVYDADALSNESSRAINISTRGVAGAGPNKMIAGFVINGASSRRVLIRAVGPAIGAAPFNVGGTLAEPQIELFNSRNFLHASAGAWGLQANADEIRGAAKTVGAFDLPEGSKDAALLITLLPGAWTVQVGGVGDGTGVVLVEVYALP